MQMLMGIINADANNETNVMLLIKCLLFITTGILFYYLAGICAEKLLHLPLTFCEKPCAGFLLFWGTAEAVGWFFTAFRLPFLIFEVLILCLLGGITVYGLRLLVTCRNRMPARLQSGSSVREKGRTRREKTAGLLLLVLSIAVILIMIVLSEYWYRPDTDDAFYVSNVALFAQSGRLNAYDSSFGNPQLGTVPMYDFQVYESVMAVLCRLFRISATVMMHSFCLPVYLVLSASAFYLLGRTLGEGNPLEGGLYFLLLSAAHLFGGYSGYSEGTFLIGRLWQGKTLYLLVLLPVLIALVLRSDSKRQSFYPLQICLCALAGMAMNPTSSFMLGFQLLFMTIVLCLRKGSLKPFLDILPFCAVEAFFLLMIYSRTRQYAGQIAAASEAGNHFIQETLSTFLGGRLVLLLFFLLAAGILWKFGTPRDRLYLVYTPLLMFAILWNPWTGRLVAQKITTVPTYWRVFWLIPIAPAIARAAIVLLHRARSFPLRRACVLGIALVLLVFPFQSTISLQKRPFRISENWEKLPPPILVLGAEAVRLKDRPVVLACRDFATTMRQEFTEIELIVSREQYIKDLFLYRGKQQEAEERLWLDQAVNGLIRDDPGFPEKMDRMLEKYRVDFIIIKSNRRKLTGQLESIGWRKAASTEAHTLLRKVY